MSDNLKNRYNFELRLANKDEIDVLAEYLARKNWEDSQKYDNSSESKVITSDATNFIKNDKNIILGLIQDKVLIQDYKNFDVSIFVYNYIQEQKTNVIMSTTFRVLKTKNGMEHLTNEDVIFKLSDLKKHPYHNSKKTGRPNRPASKSVQKTIEVKKYLENNPGESMDDVCHKFGFSKTTYYRVSKWLTGKKYVAR